MRCYPVSLSHCDVPLAVVRAGFPSPALDYPDTKIDLNTHLIKHPAATFFVRVEGDSMEGKGIFHGDLLVVDKSLDVKNGSIVVAILNGDFTLKEFFQDQNKRVCLKPANKAYASIHVSMEDEFAVWGVVTAVIHSVL
jgi:DNA polymerase V